MRVKIISFLLFLLYALFAYFQLNDPDPVLWVILYGIVALFSLTRVFGYYNLKLVIGMMIVLGIYSLIYVPGVIEWLGQPNKEELFGAMYKDKMYIEESREFIGLMIALAGLFYHYKDRT